MSDSSDIVRWGTDPHMHRAVMSATMHVDSSIAQLARLEDPARAARARDLLFMSVRNLESARVGAVICERLEGESHEELLEMLRADADALEHTGMSLALEDTMTALDLCAATTEACFDPAWTGNRGRLADLGVRTKGWVPPMLREWKEGTLKHQDYEFLRIWRDALTHRAYEWLGEPLTGLSPEDRRWIYPRVAQLVGAPLDAPPARFMVPHNLNDAVTIGADQVRRFCVALDASLPAR